MSHGAQVSFGNHRVDVIQCAISIPDAGRWVAELRLPNNPGFADALEKAVALNTLTTLSFDDNEMVGTLFNVGNFGAFANVTLSGGAGDPLYKPAARHFVNSTVRDIIKSIFLTSGDELDEKKSDGTILSRMERSTHINSEAYIGKQLTKFLQRHGAIWKATHEGRIAVVSSVAGEAVIPGSSRLIDASHPEGTLTFGVNTFDVLPTPGVHEGTLFRELEVLFLKDGRQLRMIESPTYITGDVANERLQNEAVYTRSYTAKVVKENTDGTYQVRPNSPIVAGAGLDRVPVRLGLPNMAVKGVSNGTKCVLSFDESDCTLPYISAFDVKSGDAVLTVGGPAADFVGLSAKIDANFKALVDNLNTTAAWNTGTGPSAPGLITKIGALPSVAAKKLKTE